MIKALILDDELKNVEILKRDLKDHCLNVNVIGSFTKPSEAISYLTKHTVDVIFLDISMPEMNGFEFLSNFESPDFKVIFVTAFEEFALQAFDFYALDYLVKPVNPIKLQRAVEKLGQISYEFQKMEEMLRAIQQIYQKSNLLSIPTLNGLEMIDLDDIKYLMAEGNYVELFLKQDKLVVSKSLGDFEKVLDAKKFIRIHNSYIVKVSEIKKYIRGDGGIVELIGGIQLPVSRLNKPKLLQLIKVDF